MAIHDAAVVALNALALCSRLSSYSVRVYPGRWTERNVSLLEVRMEIEVPGGVMRDAVLFNSIVLGSMKVPDVHIDRQIEESYLSLIATVDKGSHEGSRNESHA